MRYVLLLAASITLSVALVVKTKEECKCFEEFEPEKEGDNWFCRGKKNFRIYECGEEKPPRCICSDKGKKITLDLGETDCTSTNHRHVDDLFCEPRAEWDEYFKRHPHRRLIVEPTPPF
ncbi:unnamed protein product [Acanthoscelides obtectus]|uniref:Uncharacterized protein n=1 Tax=Acanthoscelides obtectus TaxID=200917 RepID=A0A9P0MIQ0_ACAOB|nr:unnamed protein product [Acanthoscelides obtectus]CAK1643950.1 hypothetical protein AOBTE_LOCUS13737 [Acanthoscelides obtectus]